MGPLDKGTTSLERVEDGRSEDLGGLDMTGFEGEWFDAHDVQGYLEERYACKLDPRSSFAECVIEDDDVASTPSGSGSQLQFSSNPRRIADNHVSPSLTHSSTDSSTASSASITPPTNPYNLPTTAPYGMDMNFNQVPTSAFPGEYPKLVNFDISFDQTLGLDLAPGYDYGYAGNNAMNISGMDLGLGMMGASPESLPLVRQTRKKIAWLDITRLIDGKYPPTDAMINSWLTIGTEMIQHGVCLGRAPGFRRKDVDMAVQKALISTY